MNHFARALILPALLALAACSSTGPTTRVTQAPLVTTAPQMASLPATPSPAQSTAAALSTTDVTPFIDPGAVGRLTEQDRSQASSAQFYALQFGRPGAPRAWKGAAGTSGQVSVGPYVRVNSLDCREFTHAVSVGGQSFSRKGTACRELDGRWTVVDASAG